MDPERIHAYLQAACAGLGFDIGEVWFSAVDRKHDNLTKAAGKNFLHGKGSLNICRCIQGTERAAMNL